MLGLAQGLTEFLPVSSSGHLVLVEALLGLEPPGVLVEVILHVATLGAVGIVYADRLGGLVRGAARGERDAWRYVGLLGLASVPAGIAGGVFGSFFERIFHSVPLVGASLLVTGLLLWSTRWVRSGDDVLPGAVGACGIGIAQAGAILPGISRSGATVTVAMWLGVDPVRAAEFSFLLAIPAIAGAAVLQIPDLATSGSAVAWGPVGVSFLVALVSGVAAIRLLVRLLARRAFHLFAPYCWLIGTAVLVWVR